MRGQVGLEVWLNFGHSARTSGNTSSHKSVPGVGSIDRIGQLRGKSIGQKIKIPSQLFLYLGDQ